MMDKGTLRELQRANDLKEREINVLEALTELSRLRRRPKNCLETVAAWWNKLRMDSERVNY